MAIIFRPTLSGSTSRNLIANFATDVEHVQPLSDISHNCGVSPCTLTGKFAPGRAGQKRTNFRHQHPTKRLPGCEVAVSDAPSGQLIVVVKQKTAKR